MPEKDQQPSYEQFADWVSDAVSRLYDSPYLQKHPLAQILPGVHGATPLGRGQNLRRALHQAIEALRPAAGTPAQSPDWRAYHLLELRYVEGSNPAEAMSQLGLARTQYFAEQARALAALVDVLWQQWQHGQRESAASPPATQQGDDAFSSEMERLSAQATPQQVDLRELLPELRRAVAPLAHAQGVALHVQQMHLAPLYVDRVILRQAALQAIICAIEGVPGGRAEVSGYIKARDMGIAIVAHAASGTAQCDANRLANCSRLLRAIGGQLRLEHTDDGRWEARLAWPASEPRILLVVDDNPDFADLLRRYMLGYGWQVIGATEGEHVRQAVSQTRPTVVILDVMMPREDGWALLMALKAGADTRTIPIIVCSVLEEPQMALSLGAAGFLAKPVTQQALLEALMPWTAGRASPVTEH